MTNDWFAKYAELYSKGGVILLSLLLCYIVPFLHYLPPIYPPQFFGENYDFFKSKYIKRVAILSLS